MAVSGYIVNLRSAGLHETLSQTSSSRHLGDLRCQRFLALHITQSLGGGKGKQMEDLPSPSGAIWNRWLPRSPQRGRERAASSAGFPRNKTETEIGMQDVS